MCFIFEYVHIGMSFIREFKVKKKKKNMYIYKNTKTKKELIIIKVIIEK